MDKRSCSKASVYFITIVLLLSMFVTTAFASDTAGKIIDILIPGVDDLIEEFAEQDVFSKSSYTILHDSGLGKAGTITIDLDDNTIKMIGNEEKRKYTFLDNDDGELGFTLTLGGVILTVNNTDLLDYGVKVFLVSDGDTDLLDEDGLSTASEMFINKLDL